MFGWIVPFIIILIMLGVLSISSDTLRHITQGADSTAWQSLTWMSLVVTIGLIIGLWLWRRYDFAQWSFIHGTFAYRMKTSHKVRILELILGSCVALTALSNSMTQRIAQIESSINDVVYVEATVTPVGLSDTVWHQDDTSQYGITSKSNGMGDGNNIKETQASTDPSSYRQLVTLTNIQRFTELTQTGFDAERHNNPLLSTLASSKNHVQPTPPTANLSSQKPNLPSQMTVLLKSYRADDAWLNELSPTSQTILRLALYPIQENANDPSDTASDFSEYRWLSTRHATANAMLLNNANDSDKHTGNQVDGKTVHRIIPIPNPSLTQRINDIRYEFRQHFILKFNAMDGNNQSQAVTLSLLTGDRSLINLETKSLYRFAGISHLLAISGTHVLFLAILLSQLASGMVSTFRPTWFQRLPRWELRFWVAVSVAFIYALFAGFDVPAVRTAMMLMAVGLLRYLLIDVPILKVLLWLAALMAWVDIFVLWQAGFWLSFVAVACLLVYGMRWQLKRSDEELSLIQWTRQQQHQKGFVWHEQGTGEQIEHVLPEPSVFHKLADWVKCTFLQFVKLQLWITLALLPISLWLFGKVSLWGMVVNLFAIGFFGWIVVPLNLLAGVLYFIVPPVADLLWIMIAGLLDGFHGLLEFLHHIAQYTGWLHYDLDVTVLMLIAMVSLPFLLPKRVISRLWVVPVALISLLSFFVPSMLTETSTHKSFDQPALGTMASSRITIQPLDTGSRQVSAVLVSIPNIQSTSRHQSLFSRLFSILHRERDQHWLLLSHYPRLKFNRAQPHFFSTSQGRKMMEKLYDALQKHNVATLTGVVGQTTTLELVEAVGQLRKSMPIANYWQAGWSNTKPMPQSNGLKVTPQPCVVGKAWQADGVTMTAVTGWQNINDKKVHDCTITLTSNNESTHVFYTSNQPMLADLWSLMCVDSDKDLSGMATSATWWLSAQSKPSVELLQKLDAQGMRVIANVLTNPSNEVVDVQQWLDIGQ